MRASRLFPKHHDNVPSTPTSPRPFARPRPSRSCPFASCRADATTAGRSAVRPLLFFLPSPASSTPSPLLWALPPQPSRLPHADPQTCKRSRSRPGRLEGRLPFLLPTSVKSRTAAVRTAVTGSWVLRNSHRIVSSVDVTERQTPFWHDQPSTRLRPPRRILTDTTIPIAGTRYMRKSDTYTYWITSRKQQQKSAPRRRIPWQTHAAKRSIHQLGTPLARLASPCSAWRPTRPPLVASSAR